MKHIFFIVLLCFCSVFSLSGCTIEETSQKYFGDNAPANFTEPEYKKVQDACWDIIEQKAAEKHVEPTLDDSFVQKYLDLDSLDDLEKAVKIGIRATMNEAGYKKNEIQLMKDLFAQEEIQIMASSNPAEKEQEMNDALAALAAKANQNTDVFLQEHYQMNQSDFDNFVGRKAQEFLYTPDSSESSTSSGFTTKSIEESSENSVSSSETTAEDTTATESTKTESTQTDSTALSQETSSLPEEGTTYSESPFSEIIN